MKPQTRYARSGDVKLSGVVVHIGARIAALAKGGEVLVSGTVRDLVAGSGLKFADRGSTHSKASRASGASSPST